MTESVLDALTHPIVQAPMGGGPGAPALATAVSRAGGLGFLAAGYKTPDAVRGEIDEVRAGLPNQAPFGVNVFAPPGRRADPAVVAAYADTLRDEATRLEVELGNPRWDDDHYADKLELLAAERVAVVSFTFGCPSRSDVSRLQDAGSAVWVTVTTVDEARAAQAAGADALVVQGVEAGGHRGTFDDDAPGDIGLLALLQLVRAAVGDGLPLVAAGGVGTGSGIAAVLVAGAAAAQLGTAFLLCPEAGTGAAHRDAITAASARTALTRAFTGRTARGIANRFMREHTAPSAYPEVHHLTAPLRAAARSQGATDSLHLWAGQTFPLAASAPAAELVVRLADDARTALAAAARRFGAAP
jgi:nitronate monooxygenase